MDLQLDNVEKKERKKQSPTETYIRPFGNPLHNNMAPKWKKKLPNHILFKLEFMMFITNDVDPWWMQMRNERAKIVPSHCRSEYQIECSASAVLVDILASWIRRESVRFALNIIDFMFVFITLFSYKNPYFHWLIQWVALYVTIIDPIP